MATVTDRTAGIIGDFGVKAPATVCATTNIVLNGEQTIDGVLTSASDVLLTGQTNSTQNGIYTSDSGDWVRRADFDGTRDARKGTLLYVTSGTSNSGFWYVTTSNPVVPDGSAAVNFARSSTTLAVISAFGQQVIATADAAALRTLISVLQTSQIQSWSSLTAVNSGTADALVGVYSPVITAATNNMLLILECNAANTITTPTFTPANGVLVAKTIVRSNGGALAVGDIAGANFKALLCFDTSLDQWILINPYSGPTQLTATVSRASNTILALADNNSFIYSTGTFTQTLTAAATLGNGWHVTYRNDGTGIITIDPNGGELIDGATTIRLYRGESCVITCTGTAFITSGRSTGMVLIDQKIASSSATLDFVQGFNSDFDELHFRITALTPATNDTILYTRISEDGGSTYKAGGSDYATQNLSLQAGVVAGSVGTAAQASSGFGASNTITEGGANGEYQLFNATSTVADKWWKWSLAGQRSGSGPLKIDGNGRYITDAGAINGFRFLFAAGNIASGTISMYGLRK